MKKSLTFKLFILIFCAIFLTSMAGLLTVSLYSKNYFLKYKMNDFKTSIVSLITESQSTKLPTLKLDYYANTKNAYIEIYTKNMEHLYSSEFPVKKTNLPFRNIVKRPTKQTNRFIKENDNLYTWTGFLNNKYIAYIAIPSENITNVLKVIQKILLYLIPIGFFFAVIAALFVSYYVSNPIITLNNTARKIGQLNFKVKYQQKRNDEIGELGNTLNWLSNQLNNTFSQLRGELEKEKKLDKLRNTFISQVSHELKTPIAVINSYTDAILDEIPQTKEETNDCLMVIKSECEKVNQMIKSLLDISQIKSGVIKIKNDDINIKLMLEETFKRHNEIIKTTKFVLKNLKNDKFTSGDISKLIQVLDNFIQNALKHTPSSGFIKLGADINGNFIDVYVENSGPIIEDNHLPHIWDSFYKVGDKEGSGLGLSIAKNILNAHGFKYYAQTLEYGMRFGFLAKISL